MIDQPTVFIVDDDELTCQTLAATLQAMELRSETFESADKFLQNYDPRRPGCMLIDLRMPGMSGLELLARLASYETRIPAVMLSCFAEVRSAVQAMKLGAVDFLEKPYRLAELRETIWKALQLDAVRRRKALPKPGDPWRRFKSLNDDERQVLQMTVEGKPNKAIAKRLGIGLRTVHVRRAAIMRKLNVRSRAELVQLAVAADLQAGYQAISPPHPIGREATMAPLVR